MTEHARITPATASVGPVETPAASAADGSESTIDAAQIVPARPRPRRPSRRIAWAGYRAGVALLAVAVAAGGVWWSEQRPQGVAIAAAHDETETTGHEPDGHPSDQHQSQPGPTVAPAAAGLLVEWSTEPAQPRPGEPVVISYHVVDERSGETITDLPLNHERPMHLIITSQDLAQFDHVHPELGADGVYRIETTLAAPGGYRLFSEFVFNGETVLDERAVTVGDAPGATADLAPDLAAKTVDGVTVALAEPPPVQAGAAVQYTFTVSQDGQPVTNLSPYLGAAAHVAIVSEDSESFAHTHGEATTGSADPDAAEAGGSHGSSGDHGTGGDHGSSAGHDTGGNHETGGDHPSTGDHAVPAAFGPEVVVEHTFPAPGLYRLWIQVNLDDQIITAPFTIEVK